MGAPARIPSPPAQMRMMLAELRDAGDVFEHAWASAWRRIEWPHDTEIRREWKRCLTWAKPEFSAAYAEVATTSEGRMLALRAPWERVEQKLAPRARLVA